MPESNINSVVEDLIFLQPLLYKTLIKPAKCVSPLSPGALFVMGVLKRKGDLPMSEIGRRLSMPKPHVTTIVDKLIADSLVERLNDPNDRRVVMVHLTELGANTLAAVKKDISEDLRLKLEKLDEAKLQQLASSVNHVRETLTFLLEDAGIPICDGTPKC